MENKPTGNAKLDRARFHTLEAARQDYVAIIPQEHTLEEIAGNPGYWSVIANQCRPFGRIEARAEDGTWIAEFVITEVGRQFVRVKQLQLYKLTASDVAMTQTEKDSGYRVIYRQQHYKWCVERVTDGARVHAGENTKEGAETWRTNHLKALAR